MNGARKSRLGSGGHARGLDQLHPVMRSRMWKPGQSGNPTGYSGAYGEAIKLARNKTSRKKFFPNFHQTLSLIANRTRWVSAQPAPYPPPGKGVTAVVSRNRLGMEPSVVNLSRRYGRECGNEISTTSR